eukprot:TRINITY_DN7908_c0_g1_i3.p1 TRINITY_DN7908_c0_g1~~TRINITY_DN7908_c0_g1_i3.p1  ORF type:complete len:165 (-),score=61.86 TRINITY_DN7908_c0_g1_i3:257-751(-)
MKFSVQVETESKTYERAGTESPSPRQLNWKIKVDIHQGTSLQDKENAEPVAKKVGIVEPTPRKLSVQPSKPSLKQEDDRMKRKSVGVMEDEGARCRKQSRLQREEELVRMAMRKSSRKVSRQGEWLVIQEKVGLLTTQNGTQQIHEKRIRINEQDLINYCEDGV